MSRWLDEILIELGKLGALPLPEDFADDYSPESLPVLEAAALTHQEQGANVDLLVRALGAYLGEAILYTAGGHWECSGFPADDPAVIVDPVLKAGPVHVCSVVRRALDEASGGVFAEEHGWMQIAADAQRERDPGWRPVKTADGVQRPQPPGPQAEAARRLSTCLNHGRRERGVCPWCAGRAAPTFGIREIQRRVAPAFLAGPALTGTGQACRATIRGE
ncbi:hypothetical protein ACFY0R_03395 [Streptomyces sp. NPDC001633]|uniref:hypothetical protein n=1 Tax=Streptomyces sp. NPDC001633 TaxID=3364595 RepID=UPI003682E8CF